MILNTLGNNDSQFHNQAPDEDKKEDFYHFLYAEWIAKMPGNTALASNQSMYHTIMAGGYYRVDLTDNLSVLVLNSQYFEFEDDTQYQENEGNTMLDWMEENLSESVGTDRKFII